MTARSPAVAPRSVSAGRVLQLAGSIVPPLVVFIALVVAWETMGQAGILPRALSNPSSIVDAFGKNIDVLLRSAWATLLAAMGGLLAGTLIGLVMAFAAARFVVARDILVPLAIGAAAIPLIALAPIFNNWFGLANPMSKMAMATVLVFFPVFISSTRGLVEVSPDALELMRSYAVSDSEVLRKVRIPNMLPYFFTSMKVGTTLAFIGAIVAEFFGGTTEVIGRVVLTAMYAGNVGLGWAGIMLGAAAAIAAYLVVAAVERRAIPWYIALRGGTA